MKQRQINIELLRIVAMLMVLGLHANFLALKAPDAETVMTGEGIFRTFLHSACIVAVNVFVMISGWFGIKPSLKGSCNFMWQVIYMVGLLWVTGVMFFNQPVTLKSILWMVGLYGGGGWFVASYIGLYILSPMLNQYIAKTASKHIAITLIAFFVFEFIWGNTLSVQFVVGGYSTFSFIGIYILAGLLKKIHLRYSKSMPYFIIFLIAIAINSLLYICFTSMGAVAIRSIIFNYINPLVIIASASFLLAFSNLPIYTPPTSNTQGCAFVKAAIWLASSSFAAYLLHVGTNYALSLYCDGVIYLYDKFSGFISFAVIVGYVVAVFFSQ